MNKNELVEALIEKLPHVAKNDVKQVIEAFFSVLTDCARNGEKLSIVGYLSMSVTERAERTCVSPKDGSTITVPKCKVVKIKPGQRLKDAAQNS